MNACAQLAEMSPTRERVNEKVPEVCLHQSFSRPTTDDESKPGSIAAEEQPSHK